MLSVQSNISNALIVFYWNLNRSKNCKKRHFSVSKANNFYQAFIAFLTRLLNHSPPTYLHALFPRHFDFVSFDVFSFDLVLIFGVDFRRPCSCRRWRLRRDVLNVDGAAAYALPVPAAAVAGAVTAVSAVGGSFIASLCTGCSSGRIVWFADFDLSCSTIMASCPLVQPVLPVSLSAHVKKREGWNCAN